MCLALPVKPFLLFLEDCPCLVEMPKFVITRKLIFVDVMSLGFLSNCSFVCANQLVRLCITVVEHTVRTSTKCIIGESAVRQLCTACWSLKLERFMNRQTQR